MPHRYSWFDRQMNNATVDERSVTIQSSKNMVVVASWWFWCWFSLLFLVFFVFFPKHGLSLLFIAVFSQEWRSRYHTNFGSLRPCRQPPHGKIIRWMAIPAKALSCRTSCVSPLLFKPGCAKKKAVIMNATSYLYHKQKFDANGLYLFVLNLCGNT